MKVLITAHFPLDFDPSTQSEDTARAIYALNDEMVAAGVRDYACGLYPMSETKSLRPGPDGKVVITDGPFLETKEYVGGLTILDVESFDEALSWARKAGKACGISVEMREILSRPPQPANA